MGSTATAVPTAIIIEEDVRLDLGHTDLVGRLVFDEAGLSLVAPSGASHLLGRREYTLASGNVFQANDGRILIEEMGRNSALPAALNKTGHFLETHRYKDFSPWGADVVEFLVIVPQESFPTE